MSTSRNRSAVAARSKKANRRSTWGWVGLVGPIVLIAGLVAVTVLTSGPDEAVVSSRAPAFSLPTSTGTTVSLDDVLAEGDALLYFSMGVGCDGCFAQIPEIADVVASHGMVLVPVMVDPADRVAAEAVRFGIDRPILIDADRRVSEAYGMLGVYGHADRPSHSFALVGRDGVITWVHHYSTMFVPAANLLDDLSNT